MDTKISELENPKKDEQIVAEVQKVAPRTPTETPIPTASGLAIISVEERLTQKKGIKGLILGKSGIGKTSLLHTLPEESTLFFDLEAGDLAVETWKGDCVRPTTWSECRDLACFIGGSNKALRDDQYYSNAHYISICKRYGNRESFDKYETIFIDSITAVSRLCYQWCVSQPQSISEKTGKPDLRAAYGLLGKEMIAWFNHLQHAREKHIWYIAILDEKFDDYNQKIFSMQLEGASTALAIPGIVDEIITLAELKNEHESRRVFVCQTMNPQGYPAKDRSGCLEIMEPPHLQRLMAKIKEKKRADHSKKQVA